MPRTLRETVKLLKKLYGAPEPLPTSEPFELVLWENVAYLATPARRREAFATLKRTVGTSPVQIMAADDDALERVTARGIMKGAFATRLRECALIALEEFGGDLAQAVRLPLAKARRALRSFPGIGEPGAEKILLFSGQQALLAPESNGLRVLVRLGPVDDAGSYARTYAASRELALGATYTPKFLQEAHLLLQQHGQTLCKRAAPHCGECPLAGGCAYALASRKTRGRLRP